LPGILAVSFSAVLMVLQCGMLLGLFSITSIPVDHTRADVWVGSPHVLSVDLGRPIPMSFMSRIAQDSRVANVESFYEAFASWTKPDRGSDLCIVIGCNLEPGNMGALEELTPQLQVLLTQPGSVVIDQSEFDRLGVKSIGDKAEINKHSVQVVGSVKHLKSLAGPYIFCSRQTARDLLRTTVPSDQATYLLVKCKNKSDAPGLVEYLKQKYPDDMGDAVFTSEEFSSRSQLQWLKKTGAGIALGYAALLGLIVGMVVTSQTLYAATIASAREYAILLALGIPRWRISVTVLAQSFWVGIIGIALAYPTIQGLSQLVLVAGGGAVKVKLDNWWLLPGAAVVTIGMAMFAGAFALRSVRRIEPMSLLR
jgi:putative ABC transport system permease protein